MEWLDLKDVPIKEYFIGLTNEGSIYKTYIGADNIVYFDRGILNEYNNICYNNVNYNSEILIAWLPRPPKPSSITKRVYD